jgi:aryl-alcohol dehydrogenase-like predicted oxidoreductase
METRVFGKTGMHVSPLGLGAAEIGYDNVDQKTVDALLGMAFDAGLNVIDTAECYLDSEEKLGQVLGGRRKQCFLFTKCGHAPAPRPAGLAVRGIRKLWRPVARTTGGALPDWHPRMLEQSIERSLRRLRTDWVDLLQLHSCSEDLLRQGEVIDVLERARKAGQARYIGYSGDGTAALYAVQCGRFDTLQTSVNIADQQSIDLTLPLACQSRMGVIAKRPVANAVWKNTRRPENSYHHVYWDRVQELKYQFLADEPNALGIALRFTLSVAGVHTAIVGTTKPENLRRNAETVAAGPLEDGQFAAVRARWKEVAGPGWTGQQ